MEIFQSVTLKCDADKPYGLINFLAGCFQRTWDRIDLLLNTLTTNVNFLLNYTHTHNLHL